MATVARTIYSHYDPKQDRPRLQQETGQEVDQDPAEQWQKEAFRVCPKSSLAPPHFVPATLEYDDWGSLASSSNVQLDTKPSSSSSGSSVAGWYRSLTTSEPSTPRPTTPAAPAEPIPRTATAPPPPPTSSAAPIDRRNKNNWFIMNALSSASTSAPTAAAAAATPPPTLADILARDPPPMFSTAPPYKPPVWLALGPSNRGWAMLQRSGWSEGEALGPYAQRRQPVRHLIQADRDGGVKQEGEEEKDEEGQQGRRMSKKSAGKQRAEGQAGVRFVEVKAEDWGDEISELRPVDVVDLTLSSDSDSEPDSDLEESLGSRSATVHDDDDNNELNAEDRQGHGGSALLTPLPTVLKADRLGIGLKPKFTSSASGASYKVPKRRVTHNAAAMAAHIRAGEELRKIKADTGRGRRGFERKRRREERERRDLLAYLNS